MILQWIIDKCIIDSLQFKKEILKNQNNHLQVIQREVI